MKIKPYRSAHSLPKRALPVAAALMLLVGCASLEPTPLTRAEISETVQADRLSLSQNVQPLSHALSLEEAIARAISYNAERRTREMERALAVGTLDASKYDLLPKLVAGAGYRERNNDLITRSKDSVTGAPSLAHPYISSDRSALSTDLTFSWSLLDFGQSYFAAQQNADRALIAEERQRKALHLLIQDVRTAFWRVVALQQLQADIKTTISDAENALQDARKVEDEKIRSPLEPLRYQRQLLENIRLLESIQQDLSSARVELATLTQLPLSQLVQVEEPKAGIPTDWLQIPVEQLEEHALLRNPDLREGVYNTRIARMETRRAMLKLFPGISFNYGYKHSDDSYLIHQNWNETGLQVSFNLLGILSAPAQKRAAEAGVNLADQKRLAIQMGVLSQLHIALLQYGNAARQYARADALAKVEERINTHIAHQAEAEKQSRMDQVSQQTSTILAKLRRYQALSNAHMAASRLQATLGLEPLQRPSGEANSLDALTEAVRTTLKTWEAGKLPTLPQEEASPRS
ncbi:TolC family protein [Zoogloea sp.]|uniref:TolC family protein n=1 Tax=Zoogloea sp. TaxID=49181 RepID=UPI0035AEC0C9|nr:TolC family protein [Rhodocyclales bacterium]